MIHRTTFARRCFQPAAPGFGPHRIDRRSFRPVPFRAHSRSRFVPSPARASGSVGDGARRRRRFGADTRPPAGTSTSGRETLPGRPTLFDPPRVSKMTRSGVLLGGDLSPFVSEVLRPEPQGFVQEKRHEVSAARPRYSKGRDTPSRASAASTAASAMSFHHHAATKARLQREREWDKMHPHEFKRVSRQARPDRASMAGHKTLEEAKTALERRHALERDAVLAHLERVRVAAIEEAARESLERRAVAAERIKRRFDARRAENAAFIDAARRWESEGSATAKGKSANSAAPASFGSSPMSPSTALSRGVPSRPTLRVKPCAFVPEFRRPSRAPRGEIAGATRPSSRRWRRRGPARGRFAPRRDVRGVLRRFRAFAPGAGGDCGRRAVWRRERDARREEGGAETEASLAELDAFDDRVEYFRRRSGRGSRTAGGSRPGEPRARSSEARGGRKRSSWTKRRRASMGGDASKE